MIATAAAHHRGIVRQCARRRNAGKAYRWVQRTKRGEEEAAGEVEIAGEGRGMKKWYRLHYVASVVNANAYSGAAGEGDDGGTGKAV